MGRIIAIGGGFGDTDDAFTLVDHIMELSGKEHPAYLQIPTTSFDNIDTGVMSKFFNNGCTVDVLLLTHAGITEELIAEKIRKADLIHVPGGNLNFVMTVWKNTGTDKYLKEAYDQGKILFGTSSGAMCWFREGYDDCGKNNEMMFVDCLDLQPYCFCPHYDSAFWQQFNEDIKTRSISGIGCENEAAVCFIDDKRYLISATRRIDARAFLFDINDGFKRKDLTNKSKLLENL